MNFAKLFEVKQFQMLYTKEFNNESEKHKHTITIRVDDDDTKYEISMGYKSIESRDTAFEEIDVEKARHNLESMRKSLNF